LNALQDTPVGPIRRFPADLSLDKEMLQDALRRKL
jgi:hypothetical protein